MPVSQIVLDIERNGEVTTLVLSVPASADVKPHKVDEGYMTLCRERKFEQLLACLLRIHLDRIDALQKHGAVTRRYP